MFDGQADLPKSGGFDVLRARTDREAAQCFRPANTNPTRQRGNPVIINHHVKVDGNKIIGLTCRLAGQQPAT
jgi:hypothetical protein